MRERDVDDALDLLAEIHAQVARGAFYRGYRAVPVAAMGVLALAAAGWQQLAPPGDATAFAKQWTAVAVLSASFVALDLARRWSEVQSRDTGSSATTNSSMRHPTSRPRTSSS